MMNQTFKQFVGCFVYRLQWQLNLYLHIVLCLELFRDYKQCIADKTAKFTQVCIHNTVSALRCLLPFVSPDSQIAPFDHRTEHCAVQAIYNVLHLIHCTGASHKEVQKHKFKSEIQRCCSSYFTGKDQIIVFINESLIWYLHISDNNFDKNAYLQSSLAD